MALMNVIISNLLIYFCLINITTKFVSSFQNELHDFIGWKDLIITSYSLTEGYLVDKFGNRVIIVSQDGNGNSTTIQGAINMVPDGNIQRVKIFIHPGVYREKLTIPIKKPYISLIGTEEAETIISWHSRASDVDSAGNSIGTYNSSTFSVESDYFCATNIIFENTAPAAVPGGVGEQAVALRLSGDKSMIYRCIFRSTQDTLFDHQGRHYFFRCLIQGSIDFIFGNARSLYEDCTLNSVATSIGAVAVQQRKSPTENTGFSFFRCRLEGTGSVDLGRAWGEYSRIVYAETMMDGIVSPDGWSDMDFVSRRSTAYFAEYRCYGSGARVGRRVSWAKSLTKEEAEPFLSPNYIDGNKWLML